MIINGEETTELILCTVSNPESSVMCMAIHSKGKLCLCSTPVVSNNWVFFFNTCRLIKV